MTMNPADEAAENYKNDMDKLRAEVITYFSMDFEFFCNFTKTNSMLCFALLRLNVSEEKYQRWRKNIKI